MEQRAMSHIEIKVLNAIRNRANFEKPLKAQALRSEFDLNKRELEEVIENLRVIFKHPIVAKKVQPSGYYLPRNDKERNAGLAPYKQQILTSQRNLTAVVSVDLNEYWRLDHE